MAAALSETHPLDPVSSARRARSSVLPILHALTGPAPDLRDALRRAVVVAFLQTSEAIGCGREERRARIAVAREQAIEARAIVAGVMGRGMVDPALAEEALATLEALTVLLDRIIARSR